MQLSNAPTKFVLPFASAGGKNVIPVPSQIGITGGAASFTDGFPPLTRTPIAAGGIPPFGLDMNGILYDLSTIVQWANAGAGYVWDSTFSSNSNVDGYPQGARVLRSDGTGYWLNLVDNNTTNPESSPTGWVPDFTNGVAAITMTSSNVTLAPLQYGKPIIEITGTITTNLNLIFPNIADQWIVINNTTGAFTITCKTASGTGVAVSGTSLVTCDGANNMYAVASAPTVTGRTRLTANTTFHFSASGNDSTGNGTSGSPWATLQHTFSTIQSSYDLAGFTATMLWGGGTYTPATACQGSIVGQSNYGSLIIDMAGATLNCSTNGIEVEEGCSLTIQNITFTGNTGIAIGPLGLVAIGVGVNFGTCSQQHIYMSPGQAVCEVTQPYTISGSAPQHIYIQGSGGSLYYGTSGTCTITGTPNFSNAFLVATNCSTVIFGLLPTWSGSATGVRFALSLNAVVNTQGAGATYLPGNSAGTTATGAQYA